MTPKISKSGVNNNSSQGRASLGNLRIRRQFVGYDSWDDVLGGIGDLAKTVGGVYNATTGTATPPQAPAAPAPRSIFGGLAGSPALLAGAALAVVAILYFALRRK